MLNFGKSKIPRKDDKFGPDRALFFIKYIDLLRSQPFVYSEQFGQLYDRMINKNYDTCGNFDNNQIRNAKRSDILSNCCKDYYHRDVIRMIGAISSLTELNYSELYRLPSDIANIMQQLYSQSVIVNDAFFLRLKNALGYYDITNHNTEDLWHKCDCRTNDDVYVSGHVLQCAIACLDRGVFQDVSTSLRADQICDTYSLQQMEPQEIASLMNNTTVRFRICDLFTVKILLKSITKHHIGNIQNLNCHIDNVYKIGKYNPMCNPIIAANRFIQMLCFTDCDVNEFLYRIVPRLEHILLDEELVKFSLIKLKFIQSLKREKK